MILCPRLGAMAAAILNDHVTLMTAWDSMTNEQSDAKSKKANPSLM